MPAKLRIGILTGGGDVPGLNVAIKAAVLRALGHDVSMIGLRRGWMSILSVDPDDPTAAEKWTIPLEAETVRRIDRTGGTFLHTSRTNPSNVKPQDVPSWVRESDKTANPSGTVDCTKHALRVLEHLGLDALIPIGGDDTLSYGVHLHHKGVKVIGIPKTMDGDVPGAGGLGIRTMRYRAAMIGAQLQVSRRGSGGTSVICECRQPPMV